MSQPLRSLLIGFGIETTGEEKLQRIDTTIDSITQKFRLLGGAIVGAFLAKGIGGFITDTIETGAALSYTAEKLGVTVDELERFRYAASMSGVESQNAERALMMFNRQLGESEIGTKAATKGIGELGGQYTAAQLSAMPLHDLLGHIADKMQGMTDKGLKTQLMMKLFGRQGAALIPMFEGGSANMKIWMDQFDALGGGIGNDFAEEARSAEMGLKRLSFAFNVLKTRIVGDILPGVEKMVLWFTKLVVSLEWLQKHTMMAQTAIIALCAAAVIALAPFLAGIAPIVAAATALYFVFDDIYTLFNGGRSVIGTWLKDLYGMEGAKEIVKNVKQAFKDFIDWIQNVGAPIARDFVRNLTTWSGNDGVRNATQDWAKLTAQVKEAYHYLMAAHAAAYGDFGEAKKQWNLASGEGDKATAATPDEDLDPDSDEFKKRMEDLKNQGDRDTFKLHLDRAFSGANKKHIGEVLQGKLAEKKAQDEAEAADRKAQTDWQDQMSHQFDNRLQSGVSAPTIHIDAPITLNGSDATAEEVQRHIHDLATQALEPMPFVPNRPIPPAGASTPTK